MTCQDCRWGLGSGTRAPYGSSIHTISCCFQSGSLFQLWLLRALFVVCSHTPPPLHSLQESFALKILASGKPCVVVLINGGAVSIDSLVEPAPAIIEGFYPGVNGAQVLASAIFGDVNEFGRLPYTIYPSVYASQVDMNNMSMQVRLHTLAVCDVQCAMCSVYVDGLMDGLHGGYTHCPAGVRVSLCVCACVYRRVPDGRIGTTRVCVCLCGRDGRNGGRDACVCAYFGGCLASHVPHACCVAWRVGWGVVVAPGTPLFSFGQGLTYTNFTVSCTNVTSDTGVDISCGVTNTGPRAGDDVLLVFHSVGDDIKNGVDHPVPQRRLVDFGRVTVGLSSTETVGFSVTAGE